METTVNIRELRREDAQAVGVIRAAISPEDGELDCRRLVEHYVLEGNKNTSLVAEMDGNIVGYMFSTVLYAGFGIKKSGWIMSLGVHPDYMGRGIGLELANRVCELYKENKVKTVYSAVAWDSTDVLSFFKKLGFERSEFVNLKKDLE